MTTHYSPTGTRKTVALCLVTQDDSVTDWLFSADCSQCLASMAVSSIDYGQHHLLDLSKLIYEAATSHGVEVSRTLQLDYAALHDVTVCNDDKPIDDVWSGTVQAIEATGEWAWIELADQQMGWLVPCTE